MNSANAMDVAEIKVAVRKIKLYDSEDGKEEANDIVGIDVFVCKDTWFTSIYIPAITGPTDAPIR